MPFMSRGSLLSYLKKERPNLTVADTSEGDIILNVRKQLLSICLQVANGMSYLASERFIHRDLAARNCMIDDNGIIKVADFGQSEDIYACNYFRQLKGSDNNSGSSTVKLPVKWMALESLHDGLFSEKSNVWSYGVLCWEVFSLGKVPYPGLDPIGVVELLDTGGRLQCPHNGACSQEIYLVMLSCWSESPNDRPVFSDLVSSINALIEPLAGYLDFTDINNTCTVKELDGNSPNEGRLEICINGDWGTVCDDLWTRTNAQVVCRQLGYSIDGAVFLSRAFFGAGNGSILLDDVVCSGSEDTILQCMHRGFGSHDCGHDEDVSVQCSESVTIEEFVDNVTVCNTELDSQLWSLMSTSGRCEPYIKRDSEAGVCDDFYIPGTDYVYIPNRRLGGSQNLLRQFSEELYEYIPSIPARCRNIAIRVLCTHYYLPCGFNGTLHVPLPLCPDVCRYLSETLCPDIWSFTASYLTSDQIHPEYRNDEGIKLPSCNNTDKLIDFLNLTSDCCSNGRVSLPQPTVTKTKSHDSTSTPTSSVILSGTTTTISTIVTLESTVSLSMVIPSASSFKSTSVIIPLAVTIPLVLVVVFIAVLFSVCLIKRKTKIKQRKIVLHESQLGSRPSLSPDSSEDNIYNSSKRINISSMYMDQLSDYIISGSIIEIQETVGQGEFGIVYRGVMTSSTQSPKAVAVKTLKGFFKESDIDSLLDECIIMMSFDNLNVLPLIGVCLDLGPAPYIIMPFMSRGSLLSYLKKERPNLTVADTSEEDIILNVRKQLLSICLQVAKGMSYLASQRFIHRDLAARNCMIDDNGIIKVADFGLSEDIYACNYFRQLKGSDNNSGSSTVKLPVKWMALESLHDGLFSEKSDVWSYGVLCWEVFSLGKVPYPGLDPIGIVELLDTGGRLQCPHNGACSQEIGLMVFCWENFSLGKVPYPGLDPIGVVELLDTGGRLHCPHNGACSQEMSHNCGPNDTVGVQCAKSINNVSVCDTEFSDQLWALMRANGKCEHYYKTDKEGLCDDFYGPDVSYVYIPKRRVNNSQIRLRKFFEEANGYINQVPVSCRDIVKKVMCTHYYLPCGFNGTLHVPLPLCPDVCQYVSEALCPDIWSLLVTFLITNIADREYSKYTGMKLPVCNDTDQLIDYLKLSNDCCSDAGVLLPRPTIITILQSDKKENTHNSSKPIEISSEYMTQLSNYIIPGSNISMHGTIGQGEFGIVYHGVMTIENKIPEPVAIKTLKSFYKESDIESLLDECIIMMSFNNLNVLPLIGVCLDLGPAPYIIMPFMSKGSLLSYLKKERCNLTVADTSEEDIILNVRKQLLSICLQVANGMSYLASQRFIHRDLAARNCMIDDNGVIKVADFGLSEDIYACNYFRQLKGSDNNSGSSTVKLPVKWMALESLHDGLFSEKSDVWSYGVLCWEVFSLGKVPYPGLDPIGVVELLDTGKRLEPPRNAACSQEIYLLMFSCWSESSIDRPVFSDLKITVICFDVMQASLRCGCSHGQVHLVNGSGPNVGRLEICINGDWGTVCDDMWSHTNAQVVCRQLGYSTDGAVFLEKAFFGAGNGSILLDDVVCSGSEDTILQCRHSSFGSHNCVHDEDVGVHCSESVTIEESVDNVTVCDTELDDQLWSVMSTSGSCEPYIKRDSKAGICDDLYIAWTDYVYIPNRRLGGSQNLLRQFTEELDELIPSIPVRCRDIAIRILCTHYYLPCGFNGTLHVPLPLCPDVCRYMSETLCPDIWQFISSSFTSDQIDLEYRNDEGIILPSCNNTDKLIDFLNLTSDCCSNGRVLLPQPTVTKTEGNNENSTPASSHYVSTIRNSMLIPSGVPSSSSNKLTSVVVPLTVTISVLLLIAFITVSSIICVIKRTMIKKKEMMLHAISKHQHGSKPSFFSESKPINISSKYMDQLSDYIISGSFIEMLETIGQGEFGVVYRGVMANDIEFPKAVAVKTLKSLCKESNIDSLLDECIIMMSFDNLNVLPLIGVCLDLGPAPYIIMPFMSRGSLLSYLKKERPNLTVADTSEEDIILNVRKQLLSICLQVANGMSYLASQRFVHCDLAARNCMIDDNGIIKVADFGLSEDIYACNYFRQLKNSDNNSGSSTVKLPVKWMALESLHDGLFSEKSDVWSYGVLCWEVFSLGKAPYPGLDPIGVVELLDTGGRLQYPHNGTCSQEIYLLMLSCWSESPNDRPVFSDLVSSINALIEPLAGYLDFTDINNTCTVKESDVCD
uniref:Receptor protein-tyrosine kinase n=1 Tax=Amphimedon queenslandica TaxID=400682 RepID=A0A1X7THR0_AMPQE